MTGLRSGPSRSYVPTLHPADPSQSLELDDEATHWRGRSAVAAAPPRVLSQQGLSDAVRAINSDLRGQEVRVNTMSN